MSLLRHFALAAILLGCGTTAPSTDTYAPGISGGAIAGRLEVFVVDESTGAPISSSIEVVLADGTIAESASGDGRFVVESAMLAAPLTIRVGDVDRPQAITGVAGARVVIPIARARVRTIEGRVLGADTLGASDVVVGALAPVSFVRTDALERGAPIGCTVDAEGCRFRIERASATADTIVATVRDETGRAIAFGIGVAGEGPTDVSLIDPGMRAPALDLAIPSPSMPPTGLAAVVGVPGLVTPGGLVFLEQTAVDAMIGVPELAGSIGDGSWWLLAEAGPSLDDRSRRSVILQRGLTSPSSVGAWPAWLDAPVASLDAEGIVTIEPVEGATLYAIDWLAPTGVVLASALVVDVTAPISFAPPVDADRVRVRALDAPGASAGVLDLEATERGIVRFSEVTL